MLTNPHFRWCLALLLNLMMKYLEKAPANVAAILSCTCWKPSWKMLLFSQFCPKISNNNPPNPLNSELSVFLSMLFTGWPISEGGIAVFNFGLGYLLWVAGIPWDCGLVTLRVVSRCQPGTRELLALSQQCWGSGLGHF